MPIFGRQRDRELVKHFSKEVLHNILDTPVLIFKPYLTKTNVNLYGEGAAGDKNWRPGVVLHATIERGEKEWSSNDFGVDVDQKGTFSFLNEDIWSISKAGSAEEAGFALEVGDLIYYDSSYWEIDTTTQDQYLHGRNQNVHAGDGAEVGFDQNLDMHGESLSTVAAAHITRRSKINIEAPLDSKVSGGSSTTNANQGLYR